MKDIEDKILKENKHILKNNENSKRSHAIKRYMDSLISPARTLLTGIKSHIASKKQKQTNILLAETNYNDFYNKIQLLEQSNTNSVLLDNGSRITAYPTKYGPIIQTIVNAPGVPYSYYTVSFEGFVPVNHQGITLIEYHKAIKEHNTSVYSNSLRNIQLTTISRNMYGKFSISTSPFCEEAKTIGDFNAFLADNPKESNLYKLLREQYRSAKTEFETKPTLEQEN